MATDTHLSKSSGDIVQFDFTTIEEDILRNERMSSLLSWKEFLSYFKIRKTERFDPPVDENGNVGKNAGDGLRFSIVVTLRGTDGRNRFDEFKMQCQLQSKPWIVEEIDMNTNIKLYQEADVEITSDDDEADE